MPKGHSPFIECFIFFVFFTIQLVPLNNAGYLCHSVKFQHIHSCADNIKFSLGSRVSDLLFLGKDLLTRLAGVLIVVRGLVVILVPILVSRAGVWFQ